MASKRKSRGKPQLSGRDKATLRRIMKKVRAIKNFKSSRK